MLVSSTLGQKFEAHLDRLPLLDLILEEAEENAFENVMIVACQHLVKTSGLMFEHFLELGLLPENLFILGKCYSSDSSTSDRLISLGVNVSPDSFSFDYRKSFDDQYCSYVESFLNESLKHYEPSVHKKLIFIDDGGILISKANELNLDFTKCSGVEQTTSGIKHIDKIDLNFPVVNVARSRLKLYYEAPIVIDTFITKLKRRFPDLGNLKTLIIGNGAIGKALYKRLRELQYVERYDSREKLGDFSKAKLSTKLATFDIVIGCTGQVCLSEDLLKCFCKNSVLVSLSSSDREFPMLEYRRNLQNPPSIHSDIHMGKIRLLNCGFPLNFDGDYKTTDDIRFQLTRSLIAAGIIQALKIRKKTKSSISLTQKYQDIIYSRLNSTKTKSRNIK